MVSRDERAQVCPDAEHLANAVAALMERPAVHVGAAPADVQLAVSLTCDDEGCSAQVLASGGATGLRALRDPDPTCAGLADALAVSIAVLLDWQGPQPPAPPPTSPSPPVPTPQVTVTIQAPPRITSPPLHLGYFAGAGVALGLLPHVSLSLDAGLTLSAHSLPARFTLGLHWLPEQSMSFHQGNIHTRLLSERLTGCVPVLKSPVELAPCAALTLGHFRAVGSRFTDNSTVHATWLLAGLGAELRLPLGQRVSLSAQALGQARSREHTITVAGLGEAAALGRFGLTSRLALSVSFL